MTMLEQAEADVATFFDPTVGFGIAATFTRAGEVTANPINVSFDKAFSKLDVGADVETSQDQCAFRTADWPDCAQGDTLTIGTTAYTVMDPQPDGLGVSVCTLTED